MQRELTSRISSKQLVFLLAVSRCVALLTRSSAFSTEISAREMLIGLAVSVGIMLLLDSGRVRQLFAGVTANAVVKTLVVLCLFIAAVKALLSMVVFFQSESETSFPAAPIILLIVAVMYYALSNGIEGIARFGWIIAFLFMFVLGFTAVANNARMDIANLAYPRAGSGAHIANTVLANSLLCPEIAVYFVLKRFVRKEDAHKRTFRSFFILQAALIGVFTLAQELVFGQFIQYQDYPIYSLAIVGEFSIFQRLDVIHLGLWIMVCVVKLCAMLIAAATLLTDLFPRVKHRTCNVWVCGVTLAGAFLLTGVIASDPEGVEIVMASLLGVAAVLLLFAALRPKQKHTEETHA